MYIPFNNNYTWIERVYGQYLISVEYPNIIYYVDEEKHYMYPLFAPKEGAPIKNLLMAKGHLATFMEIDWSKITLQKTTDIFTEFKVLPSGFNLGGAVTPPGDGGGGGGGTPPVVVQPKDRLNTIISGLPGAYLLSETEWYGYTLNANNEIYELENAIPGKGVLISGTENSYLTGGLPTLYTSPDGKTAVKFGQNVALKTEELSPIALGTGAVYMVLEITEPPTGWFGTYAYVGNIQFAYHQGYFKFMNTIGNSDFINTGFVVEYNKRYLIRLYCPNASGGIRVHINEQTFDGIEAFNGVNKTHVLGSTKVDNAGASNQYFNFATIDNMVQEFASSDAEIISILKTRYNINF